MSLSIPAPGAGRVSPELVADYVLGQIQEQAPELDPKDWDDKRWKEYFKTTPLRGISHLPISVLKSRARLGGMKLPGEDKVTQAVLSERIKDLDFDLIKALTELDRIIKDHSVHPAQDVAKQVDALNWMAHHILAVMTAPSEQFTVAFENLLLIFHDYRHGFVSRETLYSAIAETRFSAEQAKLFCFLTTFLRQLADPSTRQQKFKDIVLSRLYSSGLPEKAQNNVNEYFNL